MIESRLRNVTDRIQTTCQRAGRNSKEIEIILVTKGVNLKKMEEAYQLGFRGFGENRVQDLISKQELLPGDIRWHFMGYLQTNKVKFLMENVVLIHSCDRLELARELQKQAEKRNRAFEILLQVNTSGEETKHGFRPDAVEEAAFAVVGLDRLRLRGLMTIGPNTRDEDQIRRSFALLRTLRDQMRYKFSSVDWYYLSMGMSADFEIAIEEGANLLRIGSAVFGARP